MTEKNNILISGYYGFDNSGDDAILKAIIQDIRKKNKGINIKVLSKDPLKTKEMYKVDSIDRFNFNEVRKSIKNTDLFISGGGSLLQDVTSSRSLWYYLATMKLANFYKKPFMIYANGIGPINRKLNRVLTKKILNKASAISLRDEESRDFILELGVENENVYVTADPVFTLEAVGENDVKRIFQIEDIPRDKKIIGISVREWKNDRKLIEILGKSIEFMQEEYNVNIVLIPMHYPEDLYISQEICKKVKNKGCYLLANKYSVEEIMGVIGEFEIILAMRLHALIYAATRGVPIVGLVYDPKVRGILSSLGMRNYCSVENLDYNELEKNIREVWDKREELRLELLKQEEKLEEKALSNVNIVLDILNKK